MRLWSRRGAKGALEAVQPDEAVTDQVALSKEQRGGKQGGVSWRGACPVYPHTAPLPQAVSTRARPTARPVPRPWTAGTVTRIPDTICMKPS